MSLRPGLIRMVLEADSFVQNGDRVNKTLRNIEGSAQNTVSQVNKVESSLKSNIGTITRYGTTLATTAYAAKNLGDMQLDLAKAAAKVDEKQDKVNKLISQGKKDTDEYKDAIRDLTITQESQSQVTDRVNESYVMFGLTLGTTAANAIPAVISGIKNMGGAMKLLDMATSKYVLIALGLIAAFEGIAHVIKIINPEIDITLEKLSGDLFSAMTKSTQSVDTGTESLSNYRSEMNLLGLGAITSAGQIDELGKAIDLTNAKITNLKKNEDNIIAFIGETYAAIGHLSSFADALNDQALKKKIIEFEREFERLTKERNEAFLRETLGMPEFRDAIGPELRNIIGRGITTEQMRVFSYFSGRVNEIFDKMRAGGGGKYSNIHTNFPDHVGGIGQTYASVLNNLGRSLNSSVFSTGLGDPRSAFAQRISRQTQAGRFSNLNGGISVTGGARGKSSKHGGFKPGWGVQEVEKPFLEGIQKMQPTIETLALFGFDIQAPSFNLSSMVKGYKSPSNEFLQTSIRQATAQYESGLAEHNRQVAAARAKIANDAAAIGMDSGSYMAMYRTSQGREDLAGMTLAKQLASLA